LLETVIEAVGEDVRVSIPGVITGVGADLETASVQPAVRRNDAAEDDPVIPDVPLLFPRAGRARITWPVESGDSCLLVFGDRSLEEWQSAGGEKAVEAGDPRTHDLSDAVAIPLGPGGAESDRTTDLSVAFGGPEAGAVELRLQGDGKLALGNSLATGTYRSWTNGASNPPTPFAGIVELLDLLTRFFEEWTKDTGGLAAGIVNDGNVPPILKYYPAEPIRNLAAEITDKLTAIKGSL
jgi:hypothetical protein